MTETTDPQDADRAAIRAAALREAEDALRAQAKHMAGEFNNSDVLHEDGPAATVATWKRAADLLRRMAGEAQGAAEYSRALATPPSADAAAYIRERMPSRVADEAQQPETQAYVCKCPAELCHRGHHAAVSVPDEEA